MSTKSLAHFSSGRIIFCSFFGLILLGASLLALPNARLIPMSFLDLLFTATSVTCVTGLATVPFDQFTTFGHIIILILIQIGGLGLITLTIFLVSLFGNLGFTTQLMAVKLLELESWQNIKKLLVFIMCLTLIFECLGTLLLLPIFTSHHDLGHAAFLSLFHAISSFCNAGITIFEGGMQRYASHYSMLLITASLIAAGGLGFITWRDLIRHLKARYYKKRYPISLNTKIILYSTLLLIVGTTILILLLEYNNAFASMNMVQATCNAFFYAVSSRSAGLLTVPVGTLFAATAVLILMNGFIGAAPASTASGVKLTTLAVFLATIKATLIGRTSVDIKGRSIAIDQVYKVIGIISLSCCWIILVTFLLLITETDATFFDLFFETVSAFATLGLSTGITPDLSIAGKILILVSMLVGRIGSLTLVLALIQLRSRRTDLVEFSYPEERVLLS